MNEESGELIYVVAIDPDAGEATRERIAEWLTANLSGCAEPLPGFYIAEGALAAEQIRNALEPLLAARDRLVIIKAATEAVWRGMAPDTARWLAQSFPGSITERIPDPAEGTDRR